jgi:uncharacterized protein YdgA (DUF945 family)
MSSKKRNLILGLLAGLILIFGIIPKVVGLGIRYTAAANLIDLVPPETRGQLKINQSQFENGWFSSSATVIVAYSPIGADAISLKLLFDISHGPLLFTAKGPKLGLVYTSIRPQIEADEFAEALFEIPIELPTLIIELLVGFNQSAQVSFNLEAFDYSVSGTSIIFGGLEGNFKANSDLSAEFDLAVGRLQVIEPKTSSGFTLEGLSLSTTTEQINNLLSPSHTVMTIPSMNSSGPFPFTLGGISSASTLQPSSAGPDHIDISQQFAIANIESDIPLASVSWLTEINELNGLLIRRYYELLAGLQSQMSANGGTFDVQVNQLAQELGIILIQNSLNFNNFLAASAFDGEHQLDVKIDWKGLPDLTDLALVNMDEATRALSVSMDISLDLNAIMRSPAGELVEPYIQQGFLVVDSDRVLLNALLEDGELIINGKAQALDQFF